MIYNFIVHGNYLAGSMASDKSATVGPSLSFELVSQPTRALSNKVFNAVASFSYSLAFSLKTRLFCALFPRTDMNWRVSEK